MQKVIFIMIIHIWPLDGMFIWLVPFRVTREMQGWKGKKGFWWRWLSCCKKEFQRRQRPFSKIHHTLSDLLRHLFTAGLLQVSTLKNTRQSHSKIFGNQAPYSFEWALSLMYWNLGMTANAQLFFGGILRSLTKLCATRVKRLRASNIYLVSCT